MSFSHLLSEVASKRQDSTRQRDQDKAALLLDRLFPAQRDFVKDPARRKAALCPRRAGKSYAVMIYALWVALTRPGANILIVARVRRQARGVYWRPLQGLCKEFEIEAQFQSVRMEVDFKNGSLIQLTGADTAEEVDKFRGQGYDLVCIDEGKSYSPDLLKELIKEIIEPALLDRRGKLVMIGTPGPVLSGMFYEITTCQNTKESIKRVGKVRPWWERESWRGPFGWSLHKWTSKDNINCPWIWEDAHQWKADQEIPDDDPYWMREYLGQWVPDADALVYAYSRFEDERCDAEPAEGPHGLPLGHDWRYLLGLDLGYKDDTAFVVAAWSETHDQLHFLHAEKHPSLVVEDIARRAKDLEDEFGGFDIRVADTGGLGTTITESLARTYGVYFEPAKKQDKNDFIKVMNSDMTKGRIKAHPGARKLIEEWATLQWAGSDRKKEDPGCANHAADAALYLWRYAYHHWFREEVRGPERGTHEWWKQKEREDEERFRQQALEQRNTPWWSRYRDLIDTKSLEDVWTWQKLKDWRN